MVVKRWHIYGLALVIFFSSIIFFPFGEVTLPKLPIFILFGILGGTAADHIWRYWNTQGIAYISNLDIEKGGHCTIFGDIDMKLASPKTEGSSPYMCSAPGGWMVREGIYGRGGKYFAVNPPCFIEKSKNLVHNLTNLKHITFRELPDYVQDTLRQFPKFDEKKSALMNNIYFGVTAMRPKEGANLAKDLDLETQIKMQNATINKLKDLISSLTQEKRLWLTQ